MNLQEMQFEILPSESDSSGFAFGIGLDASIDDEGFDPGSSDWFTQESDNERRGVVAFGRDMLRGPTWMFEGHVDREDVPGARQTLAEWTAAWRARKIAHIPGAVLPLRYHLAGETRRVYGRPRTLSAPPSNRILDGYVPVTADFRCVDAYIYDDVESSVSLSLASSGGQGGFIFPVVFPVSTLPPAESGSASIAAVGGTAPTYPVVRFNGPWVNPTLICSDWKLRLDMTIPNGQYVEVDLRPWRLTALLSTGASVSGEFAPRTNLSDIVFQPDTMYDLQLSGNSSTGGASCQVSWRNAYDSI